VITRALIIGLVLVVSVVVPDATAQSAPRPLGAIEAAVAAAACMTHARMYPDGDGVVASGTIYSADLIEGGELFARVRRAPGDRANLTLELSPEESAHGAVWAHERNR
jgi:hypothetical protein